MDWKAMKKTAILAAAGIVFLILYFLVPTFGLHPMIESLVCMIVGFLTAAPLIGAAITAAVLGIRYLLVLKKAHTRDMDYAPKAQQKKQPSPKKPKHSKQAEEAQKAEETRALEQAQHLTYLCELWEKGELPSPASDLLHYRSEVDEGGHAQYLSIEGEELDRTVYEVFSLLPSPLKENLARAFAAKNEEFDDLSLETILEECDAIFHENEDILTNLIQSIADEAWANKVEKSV